MSARSSQGFRLSKVKSATDVNKGSALPGLPSLPTTPSTAACSSAPSSPLSSFSGTPSSRRSAASLSRAGASMLPQVKTSASTRCSSTSSSMRSGMAGTLRRQQGGAEWQEQATTSSSMGSRPSSRAQEVQGCEAAAIVMRTMTTSDFAEEESSALGKSGVLAGAGEDCGALLLDRTVASHILQFLKLREVAVMHFSSAAAYSFCRSPWSSKFIVPTFFYKTKHVPFVDLASVELLYADDASLISLQQNTEFATLLDSCTSLRQLYCTQNPKLMAAKFSLSLRNLPHLWLLELTHNRLAIDDHSNFKRDQPLDFFFLALPCRLRHLDLSYNMLRDEHIFLLVDALEAAFSASGCATLERLLLRSNLLGNASGFALRQLLGDPAGAALWQLDLRTNRVEAEGACALLSAIQVHSCIREMRVGYNRQNTKQDLVTARLASTLLHKALSANSANCLELLDLNNVRVGDQGMRSIARALCLNTKLRRLDLCFNSIGLEGAEALAACLEANEVLEEVDFRDNEIGDDGAVMLTKGLKLNNSMRKIQLARNGIGARGALALRSAVGEKEHLKVDFGASGDGSAQLQSMMSRMPMMADLRFMRDAEREQGSADQYRSLMFA